MVRLCLEDALCWRYNFSVMSGIKLLYMFLLHGFSLRECFRDIIELLLMRELTKKKRYSPWCLETSILIPALKGIPKELIASANLIKVTGLPHMCYLNITNTNITTNNNTNNNNNNTNNSNVINRVFHSPTPRPMFPSSCVDVDVCSDHVTRWYRTPWRWPWCRIPTDAKVKPCYVGELGSLYFEPEVADHHLNKSVDVA